MIYICENCGKPCIIDDSDGTEKPSICPCGKTSKWVHIEQNSYNEYTCKNCDDSMPCIIYTTCEKRVPEKCPYGVYMETGWRD